MAAVGGGVCVCRGSYCAATPRAPFQCVQAYPHQHLPPMAASSVAWPAQWRVSSSSSARCSGAHAQQSLSCLIPQLIHRAGAHEWTAHPGATHAGLHGDHRSGRRPSRITGVCEVSQLESGFRRIDAMRRLSAPWTECSRLRHLRPRSASTAPTRDAAAPHVRAAEVTHAQRVRRHQKNGWRTHRPQRAPVGKPVLIAAPPLPAQVAQWAGGAAHSGAMATSHAPLLDSSVSPPPPGGFHGSAPSAARRGARVGAGAQCGAWGRVGCKPATCWAMPRAGAPPCA